MKCERWCIDMRNSAILNSVAMMSTLYQSNKGDYLDVLAQFIITILPGDVGAIVNPKKIADDVRARYGFAIPVGVVEQLLKRLTQRKYGLIEQKRKEFVVIAQPDKTRFERVEYEIQKKNDNVIAEYIKYVSDSAGDILNRKEADSHLRDFFNYFGNAVFQERDLQLIVSKSDRVKQPNHYRVGRFITSERKKNSSVYKEIIEVVKGYLVYNALYYFFQKTRKEVNSKFTKLTFFLDSSIILDLLGYQNDSTISTELVKLIKENKGQVAIFESSLREIKRILSAYLNKDYLERQKMFISKYRDQGFTNNEIATDIDLIEDKIKQRDIRISSASKLRYGDGDDVSRLGIIDENRLSEIYLEKYNESTPGKSGIDHDISAIIQIARIRRGESPRHIEDSSAIFITKNFKLVLAAKKLQDEVESGVAAPFAMTDIDLTSLLWLNSFSERDEIPEAILMERVYSTLMPSNEFFDKYLSVVDKLQSEGFLSEEAAFIIRNSTTFRDSVVERSENYSPNVTEEMIKGLHKEYVEEIEERTRADQDVEYRKFRDAERFERDERISQKAKEAAEARRKKVMAFYYIVLGVIWAFLGWVAIDYFIQGVNQFSNVAVFLIGLIINIGSAYEFFVGKNQWIRKKIFKVSERAYDNEYEKKMDEYTSIY